MSFRLSRRAVPKVTDASGWASPASTFVSQKTMLSRAVARGLMAITLMLSLQLLTHAEEPQEIGVPFILESGTGRLIPLERQRVNTGMHVKALGLGGGSVVVRFDGKTSPVQVKAGGEFRLTIRFASMPPTPSAFVNLDTLTAKKDTRESVTGKAGAFGFGAKSTLGQTEVQLKFLPGENSVLSIQPVTPLPPGEYVVTLKDNPYGFLFTVIP